MPKLKDEDGAIRVDGVPTVAPEVTPTMDVTINVMEPMWPDGEVISLDDWVRMRDATQELQLSEVWVRRCVSEQRYESRKDISGRWWISRAAVDVWKESLTKKYDKAERLRKEPPKQDPPALKGIATLRKRAAVWTTLDAAERKLVLRFFTEAEIQLRLELSAKRGELSNDQEVDDMRDQLTAEIHMKRGAK